MGHPSNSAISAETITIDVAMPLLTEFAPAKLNLYLHITGRRADGYHDLDSLAVFADVGDEIQLQPAEGFEFIITGPHAGNLNNEPIETNLAVKAAKSLAELVGKPLTGIKLTLVKNLPVASGIGGGSSDAAATLRILARHWGIAANDPRLAEAAKQHGQDVPVCLYVENNYITATGTAPAPAIPVCHAIMVNPNKGLSTPAVYKQFKQAEYPFSPLAQLTSAPVDFESLVSALKQRHNGLAQPAYDLMPEIKTILREIEQTNSCHLARMSGSGATCFGLYTSKDDAVQAANQIKGRNPSWWVAPCVLPHKI